MQITQQIMAGTGVAGQGEYSSLCKWLARLCGVVVAIMVFAWGASSALAQSDSRAFSTQSPELQISSLEQSYDTQVITVLANYFNRQKFFVDVNINAELVEETVTTTQSQATQSPSPDVTMPGLPFLPEENMRQRAVSESAGTVIDEHTVRTLRLRNITVNIYADSSFTSDDLQFMRLVTGIAAKIDETRGDQVTITQTSIPNFGMEPPTVPADTTNASSEAAGTDWSASLFQYLPWLLLLIIAGLLMLAVRLYSKAQRASDSVMRRGQFQPNNGGRNSSREAATTGQPNTNEQVPADTEDSVFDNMTEKFFTNPRNITLLFESWIEENQQEGVTKAAKVINAVDKQLIKAIKNELSEAHYSAIKHAADALPTLINEQKQDIARDFNSLIEANSSRSTSGTKRRKLPLLKFLEHISEDRVLRLIDDSGPLPAALMLDYLSEAKAAHMLDQLDKNKATSIMMQMMRLQELSYKQQKEISSKLYEKAMSQQEATIENQYDSDRLISLLESLPVPKQQEYIEKIKASDPQVGQFIQHNFITVEQVPELKDELIQTAISSINTETLLEALVGLDQSVVNKLLSVRPKREQRLIRIELDQISGEYDWDTAQATSELMNAIRQTARQFNQ